MTTTRERPEVQRVRDRRLVTTRNSNLTKEFVVHTSSYTYTRISAGDQPPIDTDDASATALRSCAF